jgi:hypothetical protein
MSDTYIQDKKEEKKAGEVIDSLIRNAKMTPDKGKAAVATINEPLGKRASKGVLKFDRNLGH